MEYINEILKHLPKFQYTTGPSVIKKSANETLVTYENCRFVTSLKVEDGTKEFDLAPGEKVDKIQLEIITKPAGVATALDVKLTLNIQGVQWQPNIQ